jgi:hypothetical protein
MFCGNLVFLPHFGMLNQERSGNPESDWNPAADDG